MGMTTSHHQKKKEDAEMRKDEVESWAWYLEGFMIVGN